MKCKIYN